MTLKQQLIATAKELNLETDKLTIAQLKEAIQQAQAANQLTATKKATAEASPADFAKAGKRSQKSVLEAEAEAARQERKKTATDAKAPAKPVIKVRSKLERRSKQYRTVADKIDFKKTYTVKEALDLVIDTSVTKFDSSVDLVVALGLNTKKADQNIRDYVILPNGTGRTLRVAVFADDKEAQQALEAGADVAGKEIFLQTLDAGQTDFDLLITMPHLMVNLSKYAKLLGPKGLMPNPKSGTITKDVVKAVKEAKAGRIEYRVNEHGLVHLAIGKVSFGADKLADNLQTVMNSIKNNRPASVKGTYIKSAHVSTTMGPGIKMTIN